MVNNREDYDVLSTRQKFDFLRSVQDDYRLTGRLERGQNLTPSVFQMQWNDTQRNQFWFWYETRNGDGLGQPILLDNEITVFVAEEGKGGMGRSFPDLMGHPNISDPPTNIRSDNTFQFNIDDPAWVARKWTASPLNLSLPVVRKDPPTCVDNCNEMYKARNDKCNAIRKRVAESLKKIGCPSKVTAYKTKKKKCSLKRKRER